MERHFYGVIHLTYFRYLFEKEMNHFPKDDYFFLSVQEENLKQLVQVLVSIMQMSLILLDECYPGYHMYRKKQSQHPV